MSSENEVIKKPKPSVMLGKYAISVALFLFLVFVIIYSFTSKAFEQQLAKSVANADGNSEFVDAAQLTELQFDLEQESTH